MKRGKNAQGVIVFEQFPHSKECGFFEVCFDFPVGNGGDYDGGDYIVWHGSPLPCFEASIK